MSLAELKSAYKIETNFLEHLRVQKCLTKFLENSHNDILKPTYPLNIQALRSSIEGSKKYRKIFSPCPQNINSNLEKRWNQQHICNTPLEWDKIFKICFYTIPDNNLKWFQYRIIYKILGTLSLRKKMKKSETNQCRVFNGSEETQEHLFVHCPYAVQLWSDIKSHGANTPIESISTNPIDILLGVWTEPNKSFPHAQHNLFDGQKLYFPVRKKRKTTKVVRIVTLHKCNIY